MSYDLLGCVPYLAGSRFEIRRSLPNTISAVQLLGGQAGNAGMMRLKVFKQQSLGDKSSTLVREL